MALGCYGIAFWIDQANFPGPLFGGVATAQSRCVAPAAPGEIGHRRQRLGGAAETRDQLAVGDWADAGRADQPQAVDEVLAQA